MVFLFLDVGGTIFASWINPFSSNRYEWYRIPRGASVHPWPVPARGWTSTAGLSGISYSAMRRNASSQAKTVSTLRTMMLWNGFRQTDERPAERGRPRAPGGGGGGGGGGPG